MVSWRKEIVTLIHGLYGSNKRIELHEPVLGARELEYVKEAIGENNVSSAGEYNQIFEKKVGELTNSPFVVTTTNGTSALHIGLLLVGVRPNDCVITQSFNFVAGCNAISYCGASPIFVDIERKTLGMCPEKLEQFLDNYTVQKDDGMRWTKESNKRIKACIAVHTNGHPNRVDAIHKICETFNIDLVEDAAGALGSYFKGKHVGIIGKVGILSFNGNKVVTAGGGGALLISDPVLANQARHLSTTAKINIRWDNDHDEIGYNYRLPSINAALACGQMDNIKEILRIKREISDTYQMFCEAYGIDYMKEPEHALSNYWLNSIILDDRKQRDQLLDYLLARGISARAAWRPMHRTKIYSGADSGPLITTELYSERIINLPSSMPEEKYPDSV